MSNSRPLSASIAAWSPRDLVVVESLSKVMVPASQPNAVHVATFWVLVDDGDAIYPNAPHDGGRFLQHSGNVNYDGALTSAATLL